MKKAVLIFLAVVFVAASLPAAAVSLTPSNVDPPIISWQPPASWSAASTPGAAKFATIGPGPAPFYPITPCRQYDSRSATALADNTPRSVNVTGAPCGLPTNIYALAVNITVFSITGAGSNGVFKVDSVNPPSTAWINYPPSETQRGNAGVVATNGAGSIWVQVNQGAGSVQFTVDVFGYYYNGFTGGSTNWTMKAGDVFAVVGVNSGFAPLFGRNDATAANSSGVIGRTFSTGAGSAGVWGDSVGGTGVVYGVNGSASSTTNGAAGVAGSSTGATGITYGIRGSVASTTSGAAAVKGEVGGSLPITFGGRVGVHGADATGGGFGVLGASGNRGVQGSRVDGSGAFLNGGVLGYSGSSGVHSFNDITAAGTKSFVEPHPIDPSRQIVFVAMEGLEAGTYFRGRGRFQGKTASIVVPEAFRLVTETDGLTVQITPIGRATAVGVVSMSLTQIDVEAGDDVEFSYLVQGVRRNYRNFEPLQENTYFVPKGPTDRMDPWPAHIQKRLIETGIYHANGTVNMETAERMGWAQKWREEERLRQEAVSRAQEPEKPQQQ